MLRPYLLHRSPDDGIVEKHKIPEIIMAIIIRLVALPALMILLAGILPLPIELKRILVMLGLPLTA